MGSVMMESQRAIITWEDAFNVFRREMINLQSFTFNRVSAREDSRRGYFNDGYANSIITEDLFPREEVVAISESDRTEYYPQDDVALHVLQDHLLVKKGQEHVKSI